MNPALRAASAAALALALALGHAPLAAAPAEVIVSAGRVELRSAGTPIVEVLQKLGAATGMKVVVEGTNSAPHRHYNCSFPFLVSVISPVPSLLWRRATSSASPMTNNYCSYCRLAPGAKDSGGKHAHRSGSKDGNQNLKCALTEAAIKAMMYYPEIKRFAAQLERRSNSTIARTVVAKELAKIVYYVLSRQQPCHSFKGMKVTKRHDWPRTCKPVRITGVPTPRVLHWSLIGMQVRRR